MILHLLGIYTFSVLLNLFSLVIMFHVVFSTHQNIFYLTQKSHMHNQIFKYIPNYKYKQNKSTNFKSLLIVIIILNAESGACCYSIQIYIFDICTYYLVLFSFLKMGQNQSFGPRKPGDKDGQNGADKVAVLKVE